MPKTRHASFFISCFLIFLALAGFIVLFVLALRSPPSFRPQLQSQLVQIQPVDRPVAEGDTLYQGTLPDGSWNQPVCAVTARRTPYSVYLDGVLLHAYTPGAFDHGGVIHWIPLPDTELAGHVLTVSAPSGQLKVLAGDYSDLLLSYHNASAAILIFSGLFLVLGILTGLLSLGASAAIGVQRLRALRYLSALVLLVSLWLAADSAALQIIGTSGLLSFLFWPCAPLRPSGPSSSPSWCRSSPLTARWPRATRSIKGRCRTAAGTSLSALSQPGEPLIPCIWTACSCMRTLRAPSIMAG